MKISFSFSQLSVSILCFLGSFTSETQRCKPHLPSSPRLPCQGGWGTPAAMETQGVNWVMADTVLWDLVCVWGGL